MSNQNKGIFFAALTAFLWGFLAIALKIAARKFEAETIVWFRFTVAFMTLLIWHLFTQPKNLSIFIRPPLALILAALALSWNYMGFMLGIHYTSPSNAQLVIQSGPIMLALAGFIIFKERLHQKQMVGFLFVIAGFAIFFNQQIEAMIHQQARYHAGVLFTLSGAMAWAFYAILQKGLVRRFPILTLNLFLFGIPALIYLPFVNLTPLLHLHWSWWLLMLFLGANTLFAYTFLAGALKYLEANKVSTIIILNPIITFVTMGILTRMEVSWIEGEHFSWLALAGAATVLTGAIFVVRKKKNTP